MTRNQRLGFLAIAAAIAAVAIVLFASTGPDETAEDADTAAQQQTATPTATSEQQEASPQETETPTPTPRPQPPLLTADNVRTIRFTEGETVRFRVRSDAAEEIHIHGYDRYVEVPAGRTVDVAFKAGITGIFEVELHGSGEVIGQLKVEPE